MKRPTLEDAIAFATMLHAGQLDKGRPPQPYILHPLRVMLKMRTEEERMVAVLHDVMEDCGVTRRQLELLGYPAEVVNAVVALTKRKQEHGSAAGYEAFVERAGKNPLARKVKIADLRDNMDKSRLGTPQTGDAERMEKYARALGLLEGE